MKRAVDGREQPDSEDAEEISEIVTQFKNLMASPKIDLDELNEIIEKLYAERIIKIDIQYRFIKDHYTKDEITSFINIINEIADSRNATPAIHFLAAILLLEYPQSSAYQKVAKDHLNSALEGGYMRAHVIFGYMYLCGLGVEKDNQKGAFHFSQAPIDDPFAQFFLGEISKSNKKSENAVKFYNQSAAANNNRALFELAKICWYLIEEQSENSEEHLKNSYNNFDLAYDQAIKEHDYFLLEEINSGLVLLNGYQQGKEIIDDDEIKLRLNHSLNEAMQNYLGHFYQFETIERMIGKLYEFAEKTSDKSLPFYKQLYFNCAVKLMQMDGQPYYLKKIDHKESDLKTQTLYSALIEHTTTEEQFKLADSFFKLILSTDKLSDESLRMINNFQNSRLQEWTQKINQRSDNQRHLSQ